MYIAIICLELKDGIFKKKFEVP